jgi:[acyl-carrier-protein] S-malonyltransferase
MPYAILFPGQGSQFVGMGADLFDRRPDLLGDAADEVLGWSLRSLCLEGPEDELTRTEHAQPALYALSVALWKELEPHLPDPPAAAAGHSLGEFSALVAAGAFDYGTGLRLVGERGRAMQAAADIEGSGMAALLGADLETAAALCDANTAQGGRLSVANINAPGQVVVAGGAGDLDWLDANGRGLGVRRAIRLKVAGAFHSPFMAPARAAVATAAADIDVSEPSFPVWANVTAQPLSADEIAAELAVQVVSPVRFADILTGMAASGIDTFVHVGPGDVTAGMAKRCVPDATVITVSEPAGIESAVDQLAG